MPTEDRRSLAHEIRRKLTLTGTSVDEFKHQALSATMFAALLRISEAIPIPSDEQQPILVSDIVFKCRSINQSRERVSSSVSSRFQGTRLMLL